MAEQPERGPYEGKKGPPFRDGGRLQELWNALVPTREIAQELGFYSVRNVCRSVRSMRKLGYHFIYRGAGRPRKDGTPNAPRRRKVQPPTEKQKAYWARVGPIVAEYHASRRKERDVRLKARLDELVIPIRPKVEGGTFRCTYCQGRTDDPMGHRSCREVA